MPVGKKLMVAVSVMATGAGAALFFRKDASQVTPWHEALQQSPFRERVQRRVEADAARAKTTLGMRREAAPRSGGAFRVPTAETAAISQQPTGDNQPTFQKSFNPVGALLGAIEGLPNDDSRQAVLLADDTGAASSSLRHKISDGDTLSKLAERYLGRGDRYLEIFELNRDVLTSPDLLLIGTLLKIPPRGDTNSTSGASGAPGAEPSFAPSLELVPVERDSLLKPG